MDHIEAALRRGTHPSYDTESSMKALHYETSDKVDNEYAKVIRYVELKKNPPVKLKISPLSMIPNKPRSYHTI